ncbi:YitT family protein [bacterium]|nr:YitT family protein [bacterium]
MIFAKKKKAQIRIKAPKEILLDYLKKIFFWMLGAAIVAVALEMFLLPNKIIDGGVIGISMMVSYITKWNLGLLIFCINIPFMLIALKSLGKKFIINTFVATAFLSVATNIAINIKPVTSDLLLATVFGGIFLGLGVGLILRNSASLDGTEMLSIVLSKRLKIVSVGELLMGMNLFIYTAAGFLLGWERAMYSILTYFVASKVIDTVLEGLDKAKSVRIVSEFWEEIGDSVMKELNTSVTYIKSKGGYSKQEKILTFCVVNKFDIPKLKEVVHDIDPKAFIVTEDVHEVEGVRIKKKGH